MKLQAFPLIMEGLHQVHLDAGYRGRWYINRWADVPDEWLNEFMVVEQALGQLAGRTALDRELGEVRSLVQFVYDGTEFNEPVLQYITQAQLDETNNLLGEFFDGDVNSRHQRMQELFVTQEYMK